MRKYFWMVALALSFTSFLFVQASIPKPVPFRFTLPQQEFLSKNLKYYVYFTHLHMGRMSPTEIEKTYHLKSETTRKYLAKLQDLGLIQVTADTTVKILPPGDHHTWSGDEPMGKVYDQGFLENLFERAKQTSKDSKAPLDTYLYNLTLTQKERDRFAAEFLELKDKYRRISNAHQANKGSNKIKAPVLNFSGAFMLGENQFNATFYPEVDDNI